MLTKRIIPCLDVKEGRVVKGVRFVGLRAAGDPVEVARRYDEGGADEITFLDITASHEKRAIMLDVIARTAEGIFTPLTVGGGVRAEEDIRARRPGADHPPDEQGRRQPVNIDHVSLDEVFAAAAARTASLVPETSGYLALALGDALARRPSAHDDRAVMLSTEGAVTVTRRGEPVSPRQAAEALRDVLARLLAASAGTMPGLAAAARPREESDRGVEAVIEEIEAALIPVNRAAARRALARLSRETLRARDLGRIAVMLPAEDASAREETPFLPSLLPSPNPALVLVVNEVTPAGPSCREPTPTVLGMPPVEPLEMPQSDGLDLAARTELDVVTEVELSPSPSRTIPLARRRAPAHVSSQGAPPTRADDLLSRFAVSCGDEDRMRETAACLKKLAGLEPTPPLPDASLPAPAPALPASPPPAPLEDRFFHGDLDAAPPPAPALALPARWQLRPSVGAAGALLVGALAGALVVARARPDLLASIAARIAPPSAAHEAAPAAQPGAETRAR